jgi:hypothetical protein
MFFSIGSNDLVCSSLLLANWIVLLRPIMQVNGFKGACYKGYKSKEEAITALSPDEKKRG